MRTSQLILVCTALSLSTACAMKASPKAGALDEATHAAIVGRAEVWKPTRVRSMNLRTGPPGPGAFKPNELVHCKYVQREMGGNTPKFACILPNGDEVRVKYGRDNGEVFAEVAATRLLWALGFGADRVYPVRVACTGCPPMDDESSDPRTVRTRTRFEYAAIERRMPGREIDGPDGSGWSWDELNAVSPRAGSQALAHRDALTLLAVMIQHTDSKRQQQRLVCQGAPRARADAACARPFLFISDVGKTFGKANIFNRDKPGSVNLEAWARTPVWAGDTGCTANLPKSLTGTLENPTISEQGRRFLAGLLVQLSDKQLYDLFDVARFPDREGSPDATRRDEVRAWVNAFKQKVQEVAGRACVQGEPARRAS